MAALHTKAGHARAPHNMPTNPSHPFLNPHHNFPKLTPKPAPDPTIAPEFTLRIAAEGKLEVVWTKGVFDGVKLEFDLGAAGLKSDVDLRPNYTLNWLPATGATAIIKVRLRYLYKGNDFGNWSVWKSWTLTGE